MKLADYTLENRNTSDLVCCIGIDALWDSIYSNINAQISHLICRALLRGFRAVDPSTVFIQTYDFLCHLCWAPAADFIFVYTSPESGVNVDELEQFKELLKAFNYHIHVVCVLWVHFHWSFHNRWCLRQKRKWMLSCRPWATLGW